MIMTTTTHKRSVHIEAPVEKVFKHLENPRHFYAAFPGEARPEMLTVDLAPDGHGTYTWRGRMFGFHMLGGEFSTSLQATMTREDYVRNERIVDHSSTGPVWTWLFEADPTGTTLTLAYEYSTKVPLADKVIDRLGWKGDPDVDMMLANIKRAVET
jgi:uncharacterized protein YndB with AHSA1/START domain